MKKPFFSVIIPTLNEEKYLPNLLRDLSAQSFRDFEVIIVDGHSDDKTVIKARKTSSQLPALKVVNSPTRHVCAQRNLGAKQAQANTLIFMDADDRLPPYFLQGLKYRLESDPADVATCWLNSDHQSLKDKNIALAINLFTELLKNTNQAKVMESMLICSSQSFFQIGGFDETINLGEGDALMRQVHKQNLRFTIYRDPTYTYSLRRVRKYGLLNLASRLAQHEISQLLDIPIDQAKITNLYPMAGGRFFDTPLAKRQRFTNQIEKLLLKLLKP